MTTTNDILLLCLRHRRKSGDMLIRFARQSHSKRTFRFFRNTNRLRLFLRNRVALHWKSVPEGLLGWVLIDCVRLEILRLSLLIYRLSFWSDIYHHFLDLSLGRLLQWIHFWHYLLVLVFLLCSIVARILLGFFVLHLVVKSHKRIKYRVHTRLLRLSLIWCWLLSVVNACKLVWGRLIGRRLTYQRRNFLPKHLHVLSRRLCLLCPVLINVVIFYKFSMLSGADRNTILCDFRIFAFFV